MKKILKFAIVPLIILIILENIQALVIGGILREELGSLYDLTFVFVIYFIVATIVFDLAPLHKTIYSAIYCILLYGAGLYLSIITDGTHMKIMGEDVIHKFMPMSEFVRFAGLFLGIIGSHQNTKSIDE
jgi:hypothetical protein